MRSLWSGVSGLRMHQIGMDVEGNNIANVNTSGFKYSRVNYATMFSQTKAIATRPQGDLGGQNPMQIGLGVNASSTMRVHSQGNISTTDRNYDVAINGNGFFMVSDDGGFNKYLTRDGAFLQDAAGNFVNSAGYVVQGWNRDPVTGRVDTTLPVENLHWNPAMQIPANPSSQIYLNANLNSGRRIDADTSRPIYSLDSVHGYRVQGNTVTENNENDAGTTLFYTTTTNTQDVTEKGIDFASVFDGETNQSVNLREGQGFWMSFADAIYNTISSGVNAYDPNITAQNQNAIFWGDATQAANLNITINGVNIQNADIRGIDAAIAYINTFTSATDTRQGTGVRAVKNANGSGIQFINTNASGTTDNMKNINLTVNAGNSAGEVWQVTAVAQGGGNRTYTQQSNTGQGNALTSVWTATGGNAPNQFTGPANDQVQIITAHKYTYSSTGQTLPRMWDADSGQAFIAGTANQPPTWDQNNPNAVASQNYYNAVMNGSLYNNDVRVFNSTEDLRELLQRDARFGVDFNGTGTFDLTDVNEKVKVQVNQNGQYVISNANEVTQLAGGAAMQQNQNNPTPGGGIAAKNMNMYNTSYSDENGLVSTNDALNGLFSGWMGNLNAGTQNKLTKELALSSFGTNLQIFDSLGTEHNITVQWVKQDTTLDGGNEWQMIIKVDEPATISTRADGLNNIMVGTVRFGNDGSLISYDPRTINFSGNNGSAPNQLVTLNLGGSGDYTGLVSNDRTSSLSKKSTDGYAAGTLRQGMENTRVDQAGNILGSFDNGVTLVLGRIAMGNVTNDSGLEDIGGNLFRISANSGDLTIGTSGTGGRGSMQTSALESSNADLSLSLTNLIVIQRGYQANSKTITTSDQLLNTLLQLKQQALARVFERFYHGD